MAQTSLRARLRRLFSTNVIVRHAGGRKLKIADTDRVQSAQRNSLVDRWSRLHTNLTTGGYGHAQAISFRHNDWRCLEIMKKWIMMQLYQVHLIFMQTNQQ